MPSYKEVLAKYSDGINFKSSIQPEISPPKNINHNESPAAKNAFNMNVGM